MRILFLLFLGCIFVSCNETATPPTQGETITKEVSVATETVNVVHMDGDTNKLLLMGRGSEPGWICQFYQNKVRLVYNNGSDSLIIRGVDFSNQMRMQKGFENFKLESLTKDTLFETLPGPCKEESTGEARAMQMQVKVNKSSFKGCAWVLK